MPKYSDLILAEKYRPNTVDECILPVKTKETFNNMVKNGSFPNLLLSGPSGTGKTSLAIALCKELDLDYMIVNGSLNGNIDTLRNEIQQYASSVSMFNDKRKVVIIDEADYLSHVTQPALRGFLEEYSNTSFIMTCNFPNRIIDPIKGRCATIDFNFPAAERSQLLKETIQHIKTILEKENIEFDIRAVAQFCSQLFPNIRKIINELQRYAASGKIDAGILGKKSEIGGVIKILKLKDFKELRTWVGENSSVDFPMFVHDLYTELSKEIRESSIPALVLILSEYDYKNSFVSNREVNMAAMMYSIMQECM